MKPTSPKSFFLALAALAAGLMLSLSTIVHAAGSQWNPGGAPPVISVTNPSSSIGGQTSSTVKIKPMSAADVTTIVNTGIGNGNVVIPSQEGPSGTFCGFGGRRTTTNPTYKTTEYTDASCMGASPVGSGVATYGNYQYVFACPQGYTQKTLSKDVTQTSGGGSGGSGWTNTTTTYLFTCIRN